MRRLIKGELHNTYQDHTKNNFDIFKNPTNEEFEKAKSQSDFNFIKGIITNDGDLYIWSSELLHNKAIYIGNVPCGITFIYTKYLIIDQYTMDYEHSINVTNTLNLALKNLNSIGINADTNVEIKDYIDDYKNIKKLEDLLNLG